MISCTWPYRSCRSRSARSDAIRSSRVSPMPIRMPEVNGIASSPARRMVSRRASGSLSAEPWCAAPGSSSRRETLSSISPCEGQTSRRASSSSRVSTPGLACGSRPVASCTAPRRRHQVRHGRRVAERVQLVARLRVAELRLVAQREERFPTARPGAAPRNPDRLVDRQVRTLARPGRLRERAVVADIPAQLRERDKHLARVADSAAEAVVPERRRLPHQRRQIVCPGQIQGGLARRSGIAAGVHGDHAAGDCRPQTLIARRAAVCESAAGLAGPSRHASVRSARRVY